MKTVAITLELTNRLAKSLDRLAGKLNTRTLENARAALLRYAIEEYYVRPRRRRA